MKLTGNQDCPKGIDTCPGSINCKKCHEFKGNELVNEGPDSWVVTECGYQTKPFNEWDQKCQELSLLKESISKALSDYDEIKWGWDGDCGVNSIMERLEEVLELVNIK